MRVICFRESAPNKQLLKPVKQDRKRIERIEREQRGETKERQRKDRGKGDNRKELEKKV
jgi:hypothetical protein